MEGNGTDLEMDIDAGNEEEKENENRVERSLTMHKRRKGTASAM